jgi:hypothetical protein
MILATWTQIPSIAAGFQIAEVHIKEGDGDLNI